MEIVDHPDPAALAASLMNPGVSITVIGTDNTSANMRY